jgi:hypothetical protein
MVILSLSYRNKTLRSIIVLENLIIDQLVKRFPAVCRTRKSTALVTKAHNWPLFWASPHPHTLFILKSILMLFPHLRLILLNPLPLRPSEWIFICISHLSHLYYMPHPSHPPCLITVIIFGEEYKISCAPVTECCYVVTEEEHKKKLSQQSYETRKPLKGSIGISGSRPNFEWTDCWVPADMHNSYFRNPLEDRVGAGITQSVYRLATGWTIRWSGFDSRRGLGIFLFDTMSRPPLGPTQPIQWVPGAFFLGVKRSICEPDHLPPSSTEVKECVELYLHSPNTSSWGGA